MKETHRTDMSNRVLSVPSGALAKTWRMGIIGSYWCVLLFSVLSYGANTALSLSIASTLAFLVLILGFFTHGEPAHSRKPFWFALCLLLALSIWAGLQTLPWPASSVEAAIWRNVAAFPIQSPVSGSVSAGDTMPGLLKAALPIGILLTSLILFDREEKAVRAFKVVAVIGGVIAILGTLQFFLMPQFLIFEPKLAYRDSLTGSFVNQNTAGTFFGVTSVMLLALTLKAMMKIDRYRLLRRLEVGGRVEQPREVAAVAAFGSLFLVTVSAEFLTNSRAATGFTLISLMCLTLLITFGPRSRPSSRRRKSGRMEKYRKAAIAVMLICIPLVIFAALGSRVQQRFDEKGVADPRFCAAHAIWSGTRDHWPKGAGLTSFQEVYPAYRDPECSVNGIWDKAHNFYLAGLFSLGIFFQVALGLSVARPQVFS